MNTIICLLWQHTPGLPVATDVSRGRRGQVQFKAVCDGLRQQLPRFILQGDEIQLDRGAMTAVRGERWVNIQC